MLSSFCGEIKTKAVIYAKEESFGSRRKSDVATIKSIADCLPALTKSEAPLTARPEDAADAVAAEGRLDTAVHLFKA